MSRSNNMTKKIVKTFSYKGLGFPFKLHDIEMVMINGEYTPKIDVRAIADDAIKSLVLQKIKNLQGIKSNSSELIFLRA